MEAKRLKELEQENSRLKRLLAAITAANMGHIGVRSGIMLMSIRDKRIPVGGWEDTLLAFN
jgi:hypothetical protein